MLVVSPNIDDGDDIDLEIFESNQCSDHLIIDIAWFLEEFRGTIYSPECFLKDPSICCDGYISEKHLDKACEDYNIQKDVLIAILDYFHVSFGVGCHNL